MSPTTIRCKDCALRRGQLFRPLRPRELASMDAVKKFHLYVPAGGDIVRKGERNETAYTLYDGWAIRFHERGPGSRQILDILLPGDMIGLASILLDKETHPVRALTAASLCALEGKQVLGMFQANAGTTLGILQSHLDGEARIDARTIMLGRMNGEERVGYLLIETYHRLRQRGMADETGCIFPLKRADIADAVGLSKVHVMRALRELRSQALADLRGKDLYIPDTAKLAALVGFQSEPSDKRLAIL